MSLAAPIAVETGEPYARIARAIHYLAENYAAQPSLEGAARMAGYSPFHFQRVFSRLVGVSPKAFLAALTLEHAKAALSAGESVLSAALGSGLSGPSRLHDLCLKLEAMTPGTYAKGGAGLAIAFGFHPSLFGPALVVATERGLCGLAFADAGREEHVLADMRSRWPRAAFREDMAATAPHAEKIFERRGEMRVQLFGTPWQVKVWQALLAIPEGGLASYGAIARATCDAKAARAAGAAIGKNPIAYLIPCHRVLAGTGALTGYRWGLPRKRAMLALEAARAVSP